MPFYTSIKVNSPLKSRAFVKKMFIMRQLGTILCFMPLLSVLLENKAYFVLLILLICSAFLWPFLAYRIACAAVNPVQAEKRNLTIDAALSGAWLACIALAPFPSLIIISVMASDRYCAGGWKVLKPALQAFTCTFLLVWIMQGFSVTLEFSQRTAWLSLPLPTIYMSAVIILTLRQISGLRKEMKELQRIALMDGSLDLPNRRMFNQKLIDFYTISEKKHPDYYLFLIDVDNFKQVNDQYGHDVGDNLLAEISAVLKSVSGLDIMPFRFGGDELSLIMKCVDTHSAEGMAINITGMIRNIILPTAPGFTCTVSIGIAPVAQCRSAAEWLKNADDALYMVKRNGRNGFWIRLPADIC